MSGREKLIADLDDAAQQIKNVNQAATALAEASVSIQAALTELESSVRTLSSKSFIQKHRYSMTLLRRLEERAERLRELRNMMELGSFEIEVRKGMQELWENLP